MDGVDTHGWHLLAHYWMVLKDHSGGFAFFSPLATNDMYFTDKPLSKVSYTFSSCWDFFQLLASWAPQKVVVTGHTERKLICLSLWNRRGSLTWWILAGCAVVTTGTHCSALDTKLLHSIFMIYTYFLWRTFTICALKATDFRNFFLFLSLKTLCIFRFFTG